MSDEVDDIRRAVRRRFGNDAEIGNVVIPTLGGVNRTVHEYQCPLYRDCCSLATATNPLLRVFRHSIVMVMVTSPT